jgi:hypothetical protein
MYDNDPYEIWESICLEAVDDVVDAPFEDAGIVAIDAAKEILATAYQLQGIACSECGGLGEITYDDTSTWRHAEYAVQKLTTGTCERCWGTGRADKTGPDLRRIEELELEIDRWKDASGLERGGDPDGVTPDDLRKEIECLRQAQETYLVTVDGDLVQLIGTEGADCDG